MPYAPKSRTRNRLLRTLCARIVVSCLGFRRGVGSPTPPLRSTGRRLRLVDLARLWLDGLQLA
eukprot:2672406-Rhodomonas_salina.1